LEDDISHRVGVRLYSRLHISHRDKIGRFSSD
jgi:hypothetical protein